MPDTEGRKWAWRDLGSTGAMVLEQALKTYAFTATWQQDSEGKLTKTNQRHVALPIGLLSRIGRSAGVVLGFLPEDYPPDLHEWLDTSDRPDHAADSVAWRFLGLDSPSDNRPRFVIALDYQTSVKNEHYKKFWTRKPEWLRAGENGDVVHWICPVPADPSEALKRLGDALSWSSPFPHMAISGDSEFDAICESVWRLGMVSDGEEEALSLHVGSVLVSAFDFMVDVLWIEQDLLSST